MTDHFNHVTFENDLCQLKAQFSLTVVNQQVQAFMAGLEAAKLDFAVKLALNNAIFATQMAYVGLNNKAPLVIQAAKHMNNSGVKNALFALGHMNNANWEAVSAWGRLLRLVGLKSEDQLLDVEGVKHLPELLDLMALYTRQKLLIDKHLVQAFELFISAQPSNRF